MALRLIVTGPFLFTLIGIAFAAPPTRAQAGWTTMAPMPAPRNACGAATGSDGRIYVVGGYDVHPTYDTVFAYDPARNTWATVAPLSSVRAGIAVVAGPDGRIYAIGGMDNSGNSVNTVEVYDPATNRWTRLADLPVGRRFLGGSTPAAVGEDGKIYVFGGEPLPHVPGDAIERNVYAYDIARNAWSTQNPAPYDSYGPAVATGPDGRIYVSFGNIANHGTNQFSAYNPANDTWTHLAPQPLSRAGLALVAGLDGRIYAISGSYYIGICCGGGWYDQDEVYDPANDLWLPIPAPSGHYRNFGAASGPDGRIYTFAGSDTPHGGVLDKVEAFHVATVGIFPDHGGNAGQVTATIIQQGVAQGATVRLLADGQPDIVGQNTEVQGDVGFQNTTRLKTTFDLGNASLGPRYVLVTNPDGKTYTLPQRFTVEDGVEARLQTQILGRGSIRGGVWTTYPVVVRNTGSNDVIAADLRIEFPKYFDWRLDEEENVPDVFSGDVFTSVGISVPLIPAAGQKVILLRVRVPDDPRYAHAPFQILAWTDVNTTGAVQYIGGPGEPLVARLAGADGGTVDFLASGGAPGAPGVVGAIQATSATGASATATIGSNGLPSGLSGSNGAGVTIRWPANNVAVVQPMSSGGQVGDDFTVHTDNATVHRPDLPATGPCLDCDAVEKLMKWACNLGTLVEVMELFDPEPDSRIALEVFQIVITHVICDDLADIVKHFCESQSCWHGQAIVSGDPNELDGTAGFGSAQWVQGLQPLTYAVHFSNVPTATAPAQTVVVSDHLDIADLDMASVGLGAISIADQTVTPEEGVSPIEGIREYNTDTDLRPAKNMIVHVNAKLNLDTGLLTWTFTSIDPATGLPIPPDDPRGFLDPGQEGSVLFSIQPKAGVPTGTVVQNGASITFDANAPMDTNPWANTIDSDKPVSAVAMLPATVNGTSITLHWGGMDVGSGVRDYTIYVSDNFGPWTPWLTSTTDTSGTFSGVVGHTYGFFSQARDNAYNLEDPRQGPDTTTTVTGGVSDVSGQVQVTRGGFRLDRTTGRFVQQVTLTNTGTSAIPGPVSLVLDSLSTNATLFNPSGVTSSMPPAGSPYLDANITALQPGAALTLTLQFTNPTKQGITYSTRVLAGTGSR